MKHINRVTVTAAQESPNAAWVPLLQVALAVLAFILGGVLGSKVDASPW